MSYTFVQLRRTQAKEMLRLARDLRSVIMVSAGTGKGVHPIGHRQPDQPYCYEVGSNHWLAQVKIKGWQAFRTDGGKKSGSAIKIFKLIEGAFFPNEIEFRPQ